MANAKIIYTPIPYKALTLDGAHFLSRATPANLVPNGDFEAGDVDWNLYVGGAAAATKTIGPGDPYEGTNKALIAITAPGAVSTDIQFTSGNFSIVQGTRYMMFLRAKAATTGFPLFFTLALGASPWTMVSPFFSVISDVYTLYNFSFVAPFSADNVRLTFLFGNTEINDVYLDGITVAEKVFDVGTDDFGVDALLQIDPAVADSECWIAAKGALNLAGDAGWHWYYKPGTRRLGLRLNDGGATPVVVETVNNKIPVLGTDFWPRLELDRTNGLALFYVDGVLAGSGDISAVTGSLDNAADLKIGAYDAATHRHQGTLNFIRFDLARRLSAAWHVKEWDNIRYGMPRKVSDFLARWNFQESLVDGSENLFTLAWQGGGSPAYVTGYPSAAAPLTYSFRRNFSRMNEGPEPSWLDTDDNGRAINGTAFGYAGALKEHWRLNFPLIDEGQLTAFKAAEAGRDQFAFFADAGEPRTFWAKFGERLAPQVLMDGWYSLEMILEEA